MHVFEDQTFAGLLEETRHVVSQPEATLPMPEQVGGLVKLLQEFMQRAMEESRSRPLLSSEEQTFFEHVLPSALGIFDAIVVHREPLHSRIELVRVAVGQIMTRHTQAFSTDQ